jgi:membrane protein YqaA with SNARE-associated domain
MVHEDGRSALSFLRQHSHTCFAAWERWSASTSAGGLLFAWAAGEATVWPILPDFLLIPLVVGEPRRAVRLLARSIAGMALGGSCLYLFAFRQPAAAVRLLRHLPMVHAGAINRARRDLAAQELAAFLFQPFTGVPFKVWALLAASEGRSPLRAIPLFIFARAMRMVALTLVARMLGVRARPVLRENFLVVAVLYLAGFFSVWWRLVSKE